MKIKFAILALVVVCLCGREVKADNIVDITGSPCDGCFLGQTLNETVDLQAHATVELVFGAYFDPAVLFTFRTTEYLVTSITGTLNGFPISPLPDFQSWIYADLPGFPVGFVEFVANGAHYSMITDDAITLLDRVGGSGIGVPGEIGPIEYRASIQTTPEPSSLALLGLACWGSDGCG